MSESFLKSCNVCLLSRLCELNLYLSSSLTTQSMVEVL
jgi:hypothetical protein